MDFSLAREQRALKETARAFSMLEIEPRAQAIDKAARMPDDLLPKLASAGLLGLALPPVYGGKGLGHLACILALEELAYSGTGAWWLAGFNNSISACLAHYGSEEAKRRFIPPSCAGTA